MAVFDKIWNGTGGTDGSLTDDDNWDRISIRNSVYRWTASGSGTSEYYLELAAGGDPGIVEPGKVYANDVALTAATVGSLTAGQWDYGDNDTLGFSTIYVRLADSTDPDAAAADYVEFADAPAAGDHVHFINSTANVSSNHAGLSGIALGSVTVWPSHSGQFTDFVKLSVAADGLVKINPPQGGSTSNDGSQSLLIDTETSQAIIEVYNSPSSAADTSYMPIRLRVNHTSAQVRIMGGLVSIEEQPADAGQISTLEVLALTGATSPEVICGDGLTVATVTVHGGEVTLNGTVTTLVVNGGECDVLGTGNITTATINGGRCILSNRPTAGVTATTVNANEGTLDLTQNPGACTITTLNQERAATVLLGDHVTLTTDNKPGGFYLRSYSTP